MKFETTSQKTNPLLHRKELHITILESKSTPKRKEVLETIAAQFGAKDENIVVDYIRQDYGKKQAQCYVKIYETPEHKKTHELTYKTERGQPKKPKEEAQTQPPAEASKPKA